ncbi:methyl-accepting chemotaxis protein [Frigidibacter sp. MR17.14]|uniref:methyl-accepting chemotaxis protein n=1 Tax=Frigidibacter sp. MR17.14 TaxID=3126509 RepID=UPI0030130D58
MTLLDLFNDESDLPFEGRAQAMRILAFGTVIFAAVTTVMAWRIDSAFWVATLSAWGFTGLALAGTAAGDNRQGRSMLAQGMIGQCFSFTGAFAGHGWIIDTHMAFFTVCALVTVLVDVRALLVVVVSTVLHQVVLGLAYPVLVYPATAFAENAERIVLHAGLFSIEAVALMVIVRQRQRLFSELRARLEGLQALTLQADAARAMAESRSQEAEVMRSAAEAEAARAQAATQRAERQAEEIRAADAATLEAERALAAERTAISERQEALVAELKLAFGRLSAGDLSVRLGPQRDPAYAALAQDFNDSLAKLAGSVVTALECSSDIRTQISEINNTAGSLASRSERQAGALGDAASAIGVLTESVHQAARVSRETATTADRARVAASQSTSVAAESLQAMSAIETSSNQIGRILSVIDDIAFQTNLLALNAGVEAARAGEAGRGFAVVASEVRDLAQRSSSAAKEIGTLIEASGQQVKTGVDLVNRTVMELERITSAVEQIAAQINSLAESASGQARSVGEINTTVEQIDRTTQQNVAMLEETTAANRALNEMAERLWSAMVVFRTQAQQPGAVRSRMAG